MNEAKSYSALELMTMHVQALFRHDAHGHIATINEPDGGGPAPRFFLGRTAAGNLWRFRPDLPAGLVAELETLCRAEPVDAPLSAPPRYLNGYLRLLESYAPVAQVWMGPAYAFSGLSAPKHAVIPITEANGGHLQNGFDDLLEEVPNWQPFIGLMANEQVVSVCRSVRVTAHAHEAGVETLPDFRGKGYASAVVAAWAHSVKALGALPMYSTSWENKASQAVTKKLNLIQYGSDFHIT